MRRIRKIIFWLHLVAGVSAGAIILVMSVTGILLTYERQLSEWADGFDVKPPEEAATIGLEQLLADRVGTSPSPTAILVSHAPAAPVSLQFGKSKSEYIDPFSGKLLGEGNQTVRGLFRSVLMWHRYLGREGATQPIGKAIIGAGNLIFLVLVVSGLFLWCPRQWSRPGLRAVMLFQRRLKGRARDWNWHHVLGFWAAIPLLLIVASGVVMSYPWANAMLFRLAGEPPPPMTRQAPGKEPRELRPETLIGIDAALATVKHANPGWQTIQLQLPPTKTALFSVADSHRGRPDQRRQVTVDLESAHILTSEGMETQSPARRTRTWLRWIHTGEAGGLAGQTIAGLASAAATLLVWTGLALSWRRLARKRAR